MATSVLDGAEELLNDSIAALHEASVRDYIVIGGWCPYLRNTSAIPHPGTLDVDILFKDGSRPGGLRTAIAALRRHGFILSAKHSFQLLLEKLVNGDRLIYNVDLLHPLMSDLDKGMFIDHLELDIPLDDEEKRLKNVTSIVQPNSAVLFDENLFSEFPLGTVTFNLVDFTGSFITKMDSCQKQKRERDAFDLFIALKSGQIEFPIIKRLRAQNSRINYSINGLLHYLRYNSDKFDANASLFATLEESPARALEAALRTNT